jgi:hypothetical protein
LDLVQVVSVVASCFVEVVSTEGSGSNGLAQESGSSGDFRVQCSLELLGGMRCNVVKDSLQRFASGCGTLVDGDACGGCEQFGFGEVEFDSKGWAMRNNGVKEGDDVIWMKHTCLIIKVA